MKSYKKQLLAGSAIVGAAALAGSPALAEAMKPSLSVGGYYFFDAHFADQDNADLEGNVFFQNDTEVHFKASGELDNGLKIGGRIELEAQPENAQRQIDDHWISIGSGWGRVDMGYLNGVAWRQSWSVNPPSVAHGINSGVQTEWFSAVPCPFRCPGASTHIEAGNDDAGVHYFSPRFNGFQFAVGYRPDVRTSHSFNQGPITSADAKLVDGVDAAATYAGDVGGVAVNLFAGGGAASGVGDGDDYQSAMAGAKISAMGFSVGAMVADADDVGDGRDGTSLSAGISYSTGAMAFSITGLAGEAGEAEYDAWSVGARYTIGPGLRALATFQSVDRGGDIEDAGNALTAGIAVNF